MEGKAQIEFQVHTDTEGMEVGGSVSVTLPDGSVIKGSYEVSGGRGHGMELDDNGSSMSDDEAWRILDTAHDLYWETGGEEGGGAQSVDMAQLLPSPVDESAHERGLNPWL
jgi:hypothetical protein